MARGWESKSVEAQQDAAIQGRSRTHLYPNDAPQRAERETLTLARSRAQADLKDASAPAHRAMLEQAIAALDSRIAALSETIR